MSDDEDKKLGYSFVYPGEGVERTNRLENTNEFPSGGVLGPDEVFLMVYQWDTLTDDYSAEKFWDGFEKMAMTIGSLPNIKLLYLVHTVDEDDADMVFKGDLRIEAIISETRAANRHIQVVRLQPCR